VCDSSFEIEQIENTVQDAFLEDHENTVWDGVLCFEHSPLSLSLESPFYENTPRCLLKPLYP
jgi:hypothetical protein